MRKKIRPRMDEKEYNLWQQFRDQLNEANKELETQGVPLAGLQHFWLKTESGSFFVKNNGKSYLDIRDEIISEMKQYAPKYPEIQREKYKEPHLLVVDPADIHIGKLSLEVETGEDYNIEIAKKRVKEGVIGLMQKAAPYELEKIVLVIGNDILHTDNPFRTTTSGTPQDTDGMWYSAFTNAKELYIHLIEYLVQFADLHVVHCPSNHDYQSGFMLADSLMSWFHNSENISFDVAISHRKYLQYGKNLIGLTHGDGAKERDLPDLMKTEAKKAYSNSDHCYIYLHHIHHKDRGFYIGKKKELLEKDHRNVNVIKTNNSEPKDIVNVEYVRTVSGADSWHHRNGYQHSPKALEGFIHSAEYGQIARLTHLF